MERIWITGGRGFAGRTLARELRSRGAEVWILDRIDDDAVDDHNLALDLADANSLVEPLRMTAPRAVIHLAAQSSGGLSFDIPGETLRNNIDSTLGLLEAMRRLEPEQRPRLLSIGSCEEYGAPASDDELPLSEDQPLRPGNPYAVSKAAQTMLCQQYRRSYGLDILAVRSFTHTGPGQSDRFVFSSWAKQVAQLELEGGGAIRVGNLDVSRDVTDVRDIARAYADLIDCDWPYDVVNLCGGIEVPLRDALDHLCKAAKAPVNWEIDAARLRPSDTPRFVGDPSRLRSMIGWVPSTPVETTLDDLLDWWRKVLEARSQSDASSD